MTKLWTHYLNDLPQGPLKESMIYYLLLLSKEESQALLYLYCFDFCSPPPDDRERGRFYVCLLVGWHHWEAISQALSPKTSNGNVASHCTYSFVTAELSLLYFWLFLSTINQILVLFGEHLDITKQWCNNID